MTRAPDVLEAGDGERRPGEGLDVDVLDLVPQLDVVDGDVPRHAVVPGAAGADLELPGPLSLQLVEVARDLARRRQLEDQRRLVGLGGVAVDLRAWRDRPQE